MCLVHDAEHSDPTERHDESVLLVCFLLEIKHNSNSDQEHICLEMSGLA